MNLKLIQKVAQETIERIDQAKQPEFTTITYSLGDFCKDNSFLKLEDDIDIMQLKGKEDFQLHLYFRPPNERFEVTFLNEDGSCETFYQESKKVYPNKFVGRPIMIKRRPVTNDPKEYFEGSCMRFYNNVVKVPVQQDPTNVSR
jgi:hypothetical protein